MLGRLVPVASGGLIDRDLAERLLSEGLARWHRGRLVPLIQGGAFPQNGVLDTFSYGAGAALSTKTNWAALGTGGEWQTAGSNVTGDSGTISEAGAYRTDVSAADLEAYVSPVSGTDKLRVWARITNAPSATPTGYRVELNMNTAGWKLSKVIAGSVTDLTSGTTPGSVLLPIGISVQGSSIAAFGKSSGTWSQMGTTQTDTAITGAGRIGFSVDAGGFTTEGDAADDFGGGILTTARPGALVVPSQAAIRAASW